MFSNEHWYERIGTARQLALGQPNVVRNTEHTLVTLAGRTVTWTIVTAARAWCTPNKRSNLVAGPFHETRRSLRQLGEQPWLWAAKNSGTVDKQETVIQCLAMPSKQRPWEQLVHSQPTRVPNCTPSMPARPKRK
jgi:hypothetical protein